MHDKFYLLFRFYTVLLLLVISLSFTQCQKDKALKSLLVKNLVLSSVSPQNVLENTVISIKGLNFLPDELATYVWILHDSQNQSILSGNAQYVSENEIKFVVNDDFIALLKKYNNLKGILEIRRILNSDNSFSAAGFKVNFTLLKSPVPVFDSPYEEQFFLDSNVTINGSDFLQADEGASLIRLEGEFVFSNFPGSRPIDFVIPLSYVSRKKAVLKITPDLFGVKSGKFIGKATLINQLEEEKYSSDEHAVQYTLKPSSITGFTPNQVSRGQIVHISGTGFIQTDFALQTTTLIALDGIFTFTTGEQLELLGTQRMIIYPEEVTSDQDMTYILRVTLNSNGQLEGLGTAPGVFLGKIYPIMIYGLDEIDGEAIQANITIKPQLQIVYIKYLPGFEEALARFGFKAVISEIKAQIMKRVSEDYKGISIKFQEERPKDFIDYSIIEVMGKDPNNAGLLGLDNTEGKDVGNLRFNDIIGGVNASVEEEGYYAFGGVFIESFLQFSPKIGNTPLSDLATPLFDDIFGKFIPEIGGNEATVKELESGDRQNDLMLAIQCIGNMIGDTVSHEIGHSLGLANIDGRYHNYGDNPGWIMDSGNNRSFEERAGLNGKGPEVFSPNNRGYLETILPLK